MNPSNLNFPKPRFDSQEVYCLLKPPESSVLAVHALLHGVTPAGVSRETWQDARAGRLESVSVAEFGAICDACGAGLLEDLAHLRQAVRDALDAR